MEINVHDEARLVELWLTGAERNEPQTQETLSRLYAAFREKRYLVAVFQSGGNELYHTALDLLAHNRSLCAQQAVYQHGTRDTSPAAKQ